MFVSNLLATVILIGLLVFRWLLDTNVKDNTRLMAVALVVGVVRSGAEAVLLLFDSSLVINSLLVVADTLYVLFFLLLAMHFTARHLPIVGYWIPQSLIYLAILATNALILFEEGFDTTSFDELMRMLLLLTATLVFVTIARSSEMLNRQPVFWIPNLIVATGFGVATAVKLISTILHFASSGSAGLLLGISSSLGVVAMILMLIFLAANISWYRSDS